MKLGTTDISNILLGIKQITSVQLGVDEIWTSVPFSADLLTHHKTITDTTFAESIGSLPAEFLPRVANFNGVDDMVVYSGSEIADIVTLTIKYSDGTWETINETVSGGTTMVGLWQVVGTDLFIGNDGTNYFTGEIASIFGYDSGSNLIFQSALSGQGDYEYDLVNFNHGTWSGTGDRYTYDLEGSNYANENGYSLWEHLTEPKIQVPYDINGNSAVYGEEKIINGVFLTDDGWTKINTIISGGVAVMNADSGTAELYQTTSADILRQKVIEFDTITNNNLSTNMFRILSNMTVTTVYLDDNSISFHEVGHHIYTVPENISTGGRIWFSLLLGAGRTITIDNVSVKEIVIPSGYTKTRDVAAGEDKWNMQDALVDIENGNILQCDTSGIAYVESNTAYGEWEFDVIQNASASSLRIFFISTANNIAIGRYGIQMLSTGAILLNRDGGVLFQTDIGYIDINNTYSVRINRTNTGIFTAYIKGGGFGDTYVLIDVTGGYGTNPVADNTYTVSNYIVTDNDAGDQISNIQVNQKPISPYEFTVSTGAYSIIDNPAATSLVFV